ncbi:MAG: hypothetical protein JW751_15785 [Polyangiaceae bacterium]|nr:hypothetical protein [Polyangiaceae bacterium]
MIDENAFGLLLGYHTIENDEYSCEPGEFSARLEGFHLAAVTWLAEERLGDNVQAVDLGHAVYLEIAESDETRDPIEWLRGWRAAVDTAGFTTIAVLTHGSRWIAEEGTAPELPGVECAKDTLVYRVAHSSEALRRALYADTAAQHDPTREGWGPGLYVDAEAIEALGKKLRNEPTALHVAGAMFYRLGS